MTTSSKRLDVRPAADAQTVEDLVGRVLKGTVRIPAFQRGLKWAADDVLNLFDSVYRGYPVGSLLLRKGAAEAGQINVGPLKIDAPETTAALWVIDGQQRMTALAAGLGRPMPLPVVPDPDDKFVVYFDAAEEVFHRPPKAGSLPTTWVPVAQLLDASGLQEWIFNWQHREDAELRSSVFTAGTRLREYRVPQYVVETDDQSLLKEIFFRVNNAGRKLEWKEVHDALFGTVGERPSRLSDLAVALESVGMGRPDETTLHSCLLAFKGEDVTRGFAEHYRSDPDLLRDAVRDSLPALRRVLSFLKSDAEIPHLRLLPRALPMVILTRFFHLFPEPSPRSRELLTRWTWRTLMASGSIDERTVLRRGVASIQENDEQASVQRLLRLDATARPLTYELPSRFDARAAQSRIVLLGMASLNPLNAENGHPVDVAALVEMKDIDAFRYIVPAGGGPSSPANRILLPGTGSARQELLGLEPGRDDRLLASHGISPEGLLALKDGRTEEFLENRKNVLEVAVQELSDRLAGWERGDRPSVDYLVNGSADQDED